MLKIIIAAVAKNNVIGRKTGEMPWHSKEEFKHFKKTTLGYPVLVGRKSFESLGKPLNGRLNIVLTKNLKFKERFKEILVFSSLKDAYKFCMSKNYEKIFIIGGGQIFEKAISDADEMIISYMDFDAKGDVFFPDINLYEWEIISKDQRPDFAIFTYKRKQ